MDYEFKQSKFTSWEDEKLQDHVTEKCVLWVDVAIPFHTTTGSNIFVLHISWRLKLYLSKNQQDFFEAIYVSDVWIRGKGNYEDIKQISEESYTKMTKAFNNRIAVLKLTKIDVPDFIETESFNKAATNLLSQLEKRQK